MATVFNVLWILYGLLAVLGVWFSLVEWKKARKSGNPWRFPSLDWFFRWDGEVGRGAYLLAGLVGFAVKHNTDRSIASFFFHRPWGIFNYFLPTYPNLSYLSPQDKDMLLALLVAALPFIWVGVVLTLRRLRSAGLPLPLTFLFFIPVVNLFFLLFMAVVPEGNSEGERKGRPGGFVGNCLDRLIPKGTLGSALVASLLAAGVGGGVGTLCMFVLRSQAYGWSVFVGTPFGMGLLSALLYGYHKPRNLKESLGVATLSTIFLGGLLLAVAFEGVVCLLMAYPIGLALALIGGTVGYVIQRRPFAGSKGAFLALLFFFPLLTGMERVQAPEAPVFEVKSFVDIQAPPEKVWKNVVAFAEIPPPKEFLFRIGIAYPVRARIEGKGPGAIRKCEFSTGPFVEPIQVWDEPNLLKFSVTENPAPMQEWTPYKEIHPPHLHGFLVSNGGQFKLTLLPGGGTRLEGTTWYLHHMWPASYWQVWSDNLIHMIHLRVLNHIKTVTEAQP